MKRRQADREGRRLSAEQAANEAQAALDYLREAHDIAGGVTWLGHLFGHQPAGLTEELMAGRWPLRYRYWKRS